MIKSIISSRAFKQWPSYDLIYEWEDAISTTMGIPVISPSKANWYLKRFFNFVSHKIPSLKRDKKYSLQFIMSAPARYSGQFGKNDIPVIVDYFIDKSNTYKFLEITKNTSLVLITSREVYEHLIANGGDATRIKHWGLSLPDKYIPAIDQWEGEKYDIVLLGRLSPKFKEYLNAYQSIHRKLNVLTRKIEDGHFNFYDSSGKLIGNADTREGYFNMLHKSKVILYTTPGVDGEKMTNGFSQVTPRFLEALSCGCNLVMKYPKNPDTDYFNISAFGKSCESYEDFETEMDKALNTIADFTSRIQYLQRHCTSTRCNELNEIIKCSTNGSN